MRTRPPARTTEPSTTASTFSSRAMSGRLFLESLYCIADVREITLTDSIFDRSVMSASVIPSAK